MWVLSCAAAALESSDHMEPGGGSSQRPYISERALGHLITSLSSHTTNRRHTRQPSSSCAPSRSLSRGPSDLGVAGRVYVQLTLCHGHDQRSSLLRLQIPLSASPSTPPRPAHTSRSSPLPPPTQALTLSTSSNSSYQTYPILAPHPDIHRTDGARF